MGPRRGKESKNARRRRLREEAERTGKALEEESSSDSFTETDSEEERQNELKREQWEKFKMANQSPFAQNWELADLVDLVYAGAAERRMELGCKPLTLGVVDQFGVPPGARLVTPSGVIVTVAGMGLIDEKLSAMFPGGFLQPLVDEAGDPVADLEEMLGAGYRLDRRYVREMVHILDGRKVFDPKMPVSRVRAGAQVMRGVHACVSQRLMLPAPRRRSRRCRRHFRKAPG